MEFSSMRPFLQALCCNSPWNYAVFWKVKNQHEMIFIWGDGFCDISKSRKPTENPVEGFYLENLYNVSSHVSSPVLDGTSGEYPIELAVTQMSNSSHLLGKGVVGRAALDGISHWLYPDYMSSDMFDSFLDLENPDKWLLQLAAGIKTILFLPVTPYGVLQLGSVEMVAEDPSLVSYVMDKFEAHQRSDGRDPEYGFNSMNLEESLYGEKVDEQQKVNHAVKTNERNSYINPDVPVFDVQDLYSLSVGEFTDTPENVIGSQFSWHSSDMFHAADTCQLSRADKELTLAESTISKYFHFDENVRHIPYVDNGAVSGDFADGLMGFGFEESAFEPTFGDDFNSICENESNFFSLVTESDLQKALESAAVGEADLYTFDPSISKCNVAYSSVHDLSCIQDTAGNESAGFSLNEDEMKHLLEAVVATTFGTSFDVNSSDSSKITSLSMASKGHVSSSEITTKPKRSTSPEEDTSPWSMTSALVSPERKTVCSNLLAQVSSVESKISTNQQQKRKACDPTHPGKVSKLSVTSKRRVSSGDDKKPKPRDRQMIQDRIKELRDLIPNSEKSSIDGLLDKTIQHMHFLRSVTDQAGKLRLQNLKEETEESISKPAEVTRGHQKGASWAVELGPDPQACPIVVKDLDRPGHMLIEMLCTDHDRFLEIADVIHRLQLTILKGLMEKKLNNSWARFIVQASGNFHRLDIFWPLMQLM